MKRATASLVAGIAAALLAPLPVAGADTGSSSLSGGGSSSLSGNTSELPPYAQWIGEITPVVADSDRPVGNAGVTLQMLDAPLLSRTM